MQRQPTPEPPEEGSSSATFAYGILVNIHSLIVAAKAFATFSTDVHTLDLLLSRRILAVPILSTLTPPPRVSLQGLPLEILLLVREQLLQLHISATPNVFLEHHRDSFSYLKRSDFDWSSGRCDCFYRYRGKTKCNCVEERKEVRRRALAAEHPAMWDDAVWELHDNHTNGQVCLICRRAEWGGNSFHREGNVGCTEQNCEGCEEYTINQIRSLLRAYGLSLSSPTYVNRPSEGARHLLAAIIFPSHVRKPVEREWFSKAPSPHDPHSFHESQQHSAPKVQKVVTYSPSFFDITPKDTAKFARIVREVRLDVAKHDGACVSKGRSRASEDAEESEGQGDSGKLRIEEDGEAETKVEPTFMLLHALAPAPYIDPYY